MTKWILVIITVFFDEIHSNHLYKAYQERKKLESKTITPIPTTTEYLTTTTTPLPKILSQWSQWETMRECPECGFGQQTRIRYCIHKMYDPQNHQRYYCEENPLDGGEVQYNDCYGPPCTPKWQEWSRWSSCSKSCDAGTRTRTRRCFDGRSYIKSRSCERHDESSETDHQRQLCNTERT